MPPHLAGAPIATTHTPQAQRGHPTCVNRSLKWRPSASTVTPLYSRICLSKVHSDAYMYE